MMLVPRRDAFDDPEWFFELKWDGWRSLAYVTGGETTLVSRNGNPFHSFPDRLVALAEINAKDAVIDGEIVKLDETGRPQFYDLMRCRGPFSFVAFDVLVANGKDVGRLALADRKRSSARSCRSARARFFMHKASPREAANSSPKSARTISRASSRSTARAATERTNRVLGSR
jgi:ATP-dependent DNA ligase